MANHTTFSPRSLQTCLSCACPLAPDPKDDAQGLGFRLCNDCTFVHSLLANPAGPMPSVTFPDLTPEQLQKLNDELERDLPDVLRRSGTQDAGENVSNLTPDPHTEQ